MSKEDIDNELSKTLQKNCTISILNSSSSKSDKDSDDFDDELTVGPTTELKYLDCYLNISITNSIKK